MRRLEKFEFFSREQEDKSIQTQLTLEKRGWTPIFFRPQTLIYVSIAVSWSTWMHSISFESTHNFWMVYYLVKSIVTLLKVWYLHSNRPIHIFSAYLVGTSSSFSKSEWLSLSFWESGRQRQQQNLFLEGYKAGRDLKTNF